MHEADMGLLWTFSTAPTFRSRNLSRSSSGFSRTTSSCAAYLEKTPWEGGFTCPHCGVVAEPFRIATRPGILTCRSCRRQTGLLVGAVMERSHTPLSVWFWAAYLVASQTQGMSAVQFQRQLGLTRYETAFGICISSVLAWYDPIRTGLEAGPESMLRWTKPMLEAGLVAKGEVYTTRRW